MRERSICPAHCGYGCRRRPKARCWRRSTRLLENAVQARSRYLQLADRASRLYAPVVHAAALLTMIGWVAFGASWHDAIVTAIAVLIITCPCALGLAIPAVQTIVSGALFRSGVLLNSGDAVERLAEVDRVVFDKTGTLTLPELDVANAAEISRRPSSIWPAGLRSRAIIRSPRPWPAAARAKSPLAGVEEVAGQGVRGIADGVEVKLGRPSFCGAEDLANDVLCRGSRGFGRRLPAWRGVSCFCRAATSAPGCGRHDCRSPARRHRSGDPIG